MSDEATSGVEAVEMTMAQVDAAEAATSPAVRVAFDAWYEPPEPSDFVSREATARSAFNAGYRAALATPAASPATSGVGAVRGWDDLTPIQQAVVSAWNYMQSPNSYSKNEKAFVFELLDAAHKGVYSRAAPPASPSPAPAAVEPVIGTKPAIAHDAKWCQPGDMQAERHFIVKFEDRDVPDAVFTDEAEAREFWAKSTVHWNVWLFAAMPVEPAALSPTPPADKEG